MPRLDALTGLRFFAALHVVLYHAMLGLLADHVPWAEWILREGFVAVQLFFMLSGYVLAYNYFPEPKPIDAKKFWWLRFARIYPLYLLAFLMSAPAAISAIAHGYGEASVLPKAIFFGVTAITMMHAWHPSTAMGWNVPSWSISTETFFYLTFPFIGYRVAKVSRPGALAVVMLVCTAAIPFIATSLGVPSRYLYYNPLAHLPYFVLGAALTRVELPRFLRNSSLAVIATLVSLAASFFVNRDYVGAFNAPVFAWLILALGSGAGASARFLSWKPLLFLGEVSFGIYLLQEPVMQGLLTALRLSEWHATWPLVALYVAVLTLFASVSYLWLETPVRRRLRKMVTSREPALVRA